MQNIKQFVANRLKDLMGETSQNQIAKRAHIAQSSINRILNGNQTPTVEALNSLAESFAIQPAAFLMNPSEYEYLIQFQKLKKEDQVKVLGYISYTISTYLSNSHKLDDEFKINVEPGIQAAVLRANTKKLTDENPKLSRRHSANTLPRSGSK